MIHTTHSYSRVYLNAEIEETPKVRHAFVEFLSSLGVEHAEQEKWKLVLTELVNNAIVHGAKEDPAKQVLVDWHVDNHTVVLRVTDPGTGPDAERAKNPYLPEDPFAEGGRGLFIIKESVDWVKPLYGENTYVVEVGVEYPLLKALDHSKDEADAILTELSQAYENLSAFYRLGDHLIDIDKLRDFIGSCIEDLKVSDDRIEFSLILTPTVSKEITQELSEADYCSSIDPEDPDLFEQLAQDSDVIWDRASERPDYLTKYALFKEFPVGSILPIQSNNERLGYLFSGTTDLKMVFLASAISNFRTMADIFGIAMARFRLQFERDQQLIKARELDIAAEMQNSLLPIHPQASYRCGDVWIYRNAVETVAGDFAETYVDDAGNTLLLIFDVMGKGVIASLIATVVRTAFGIALRRERALSQPDIAKVMEEMNRELRRQLRDMIYFVTCTLVRVSRDGGSYEHVNAGHCPTLICKDNGKVVKEIGASAQPLGMFDGVQYSVDSGDIPLGGYVLLVTDGCYEWRKGKLIYGWPMFKIFVSKKIKEGPQALWDGLQHLIKTEQSGFAQADDETMLIWRSK